jgi:hypothetical protein
VVFPDPDGAETMYRFPRIQLPKTIDLIIPKKTGLQSDLPIFPVLLLALHKKWVLERKHPS